MRKRVTFSSGGRVFSNGRTGIRSLGLGVGRRPHVARVQVGETGLEGVQDAAVPDEEAMKARIPARDKSLAPGLAGAYTQSSPSTLQSR